MGNSYSGGPYRRIPAKILQYQSPQLTLVEFEQIYDEYICLCFSQEDLDLEMISLSKLNRSFILSNEEKEAILNGELHQYLDKMELSDIQKIIDDAQGGNKTAGAKGIMADKNPFRKGKPAEEADAKETAGIVVDNVDAEFKDHTLGDSSAAPGDQIMEDEVPQQQHDTQDGVDKSSYDSPTKVDSDAQVQQDFSRNIEPFSYQSPKQIMIDHNAFAYDEVNSNSIFCGSCSSAPGHDNQMQFVAYQYNSPAHNVSVFEQLDQQNRISEARRKSSTPEAMTIYLPFADFQALMTRKLLIQIQEAQENTIVEGIEQHVSCFFWPNPYKRMSQQVKPPEYNMREFRQSDALQRAQSHARALIPVTEADSEQEDMSKFHSRQTSRQEQDLSGMGFQNQNRGHLTSSDNILQVDENYEPKERHSLHEERDAILGSIKTGHFQDELLAEEVKSH